MSPHRLPRSTEARRRWAFALFGTAAIAAILTVSYSLRQFFGVQSWYQHVLVNLNVLAVLALLILVTRNLIKLYFEQSRKFRAKLLTSFILLSLLPTVLLAVFGSNLIRQSISNWFNPQVEAFLGGAYEVAMALVDERKADAIHFGAWLKETIEREGLAESKNFGPLNAYLESKRAEYRLDALRLFREDGIELSSALREGVNVTEKKDEHRKLLKRALSGEPAFEISSARGQTMVRVVVAIQPSGRVPGSSLLLQLDQILPEDLFQKIHSISKANQEYMQLQVQRYPLQALYLVLFALVALVLVFSATWFAGYLAKDIAIPVQKLAEATQAVASGNLNVEVDVRAYDEIGTLVSSFNQMTHQLRMNKAAIEGATHELEEKNRQIEERRAYIETILENISTGIISVNNEGCVTTINRSAARMLALKPEAILDQPCSEVFVAPPFDRFRYWLEQMEKVHTETLSRQLNVNREEATLYLDIHITGLAEDGGKIIVIEDLTELLKAQRSAAWQEVARRIAHEIKNPLTPISLSAQRIRRKFLEKAPDFEEAFKEGSETIIEQVEELKKLVNEFSNFARMPKANPQPNDLHKIIQSVLALYREGYPNIQFSTRFAEGLASINVDSEQMKRVIINLVDNAIAAMHQEGTISLTTEYDPLFQIARIILADEGSGIAPEDKEKLFMPYFSTKGDKGTGLGLAIVQKIIADHNGYIRVRDNQPKGTKFIIELPTGYSLVSSWR